MGSINISPTAGNYYVYTGFAPRAVVILNRGTDFELDISQDLMSFSTQNGVEDIMGSFNVTIANTNDKYINRYGHNKIRKMSAVEIFVSSSINDQTVTAIPSNSEETSSSAGSTASSNVQLNSIDEIAAIPSNLTQLIIEGDSARVVVSKNSISSQGETLLSLVSRVYKGFDSQFDTIKRTIISENKDIIQASIDSLKSKILSNQKDMGNLISSSRTNLENQRVALSRLESITNEDEAELAKLEYTLANIEKDSALPSGIILKVPPVPFQLHRIFFGVLITVSEETNPGAQMTLNLTGNSLGWWMKASVINVHPALLEQGFLGKTETITAFENRLSQSNAVEIFQELIRASTDSIMATVAYDIRSASDAARLYATNAAVGKIPINPDGSTGVSQKDFTKNQIDEIANSNDDQANLNLGIYKNSINPGSQAIINVIEQNSAGKYADDPTYKAWAVSASGFVKQKKIISGMENNLRELTSTQSKEASETVKQQRKKEIENLKTKLEEERAKRTKFSQDMNNNSAYRAQLKILNSRRTSATVAINKLAYSGKQEVLRKFGIIDMWKQMFSQIVLELGNEGFLKKALPFKNTTKSPDRMAGDYRTKADLAQEVAKNLFFEFFFDTNGHFVLKPPFYNMGVSPNDSAYVIEDYHLISLNTNDTVDGIITRVTTTGDYQNFPGRVPDELTSATYQDLNLIRSYGMHAQALQSVIFIRSLQDSLDFGQAYMTRSNQSLTNASITMTGRPEIRLGASIYLKPRDTVYYIKDIAHQFSVKGQYTTTVTLIGARKIIYGYKIRSKLTEFFTQFSASSANNLSYLNDAADKIEIVNYIPVTASNYADSTTGQPLIQRDGTVVDDPETGQAIQRTTQQVIMKNSYIITNHPSIGLVGLIVDSSNPLLKATNLANFNTLYEYFHTGDEKGVPKFSKSTYLRVQKQLNDKDFSYCLKVLNFLLENFVAQQYFTKSDGTSETLLSKGQYANWKNQDLKSIVASKDDEIKDAAIKISSGFTLDMFNSFSNFVFKWLAAWSNTQTTSLDFDTLYGDQGIILDSAAETVLKELNSRQNNIYIYRQTADLFAVVIADISANGSYRPYTDENGRELPARLDYGLSLEISNGLKQIDKAKGVIGSAKKNITSQTQTTLAARQEIETRMSQPLSGVSKGASSDKGPSKALPEATNNLATKINNLKSSTATNAEDVADLVNQASQTITNLFGGTNEQ